MDEAVLITPYADDEQALHTIAKYKLRDSEVVYAGRRVQRGPPRSSVVPVARTVDGGQAAKAGRVTPDMAKS
jgi:hypothetical protein